MSKRLIEHTSLVSFCSSLSTSGSVITLLDALNGSRRTIVQALQVDQTCTWVFRHDRVDLSTLATLDESFNIALENSDNVLVFESSCEDKVSLRTEVTFNIELSLDEIEHVLWLSSDLFTD